jgi:Predicted GTPase
MRITVLRGVDGVVFVADAQEHRLGENIKFFNLLKEDLNKVGKRYEEVPVVIQYNKMDLPNALPFEVLEEKINKDRLPSVCAIAINGEGVVETFDLLEGLLISKLERMIG